MSAGSTSELLVADSFRVRLDPFSGHAEVRGFNLHLERFRASVAEAQAGAEDDWWTLTFEPFMETVPEQIELGGEGFPRIELTNDAETDDLRLNVRHRPLPELGSAVALRTARIPTVAIPRIKGPNIARYSELNRVLGAEALLLDAGGQVREGATTSIVWWDGATLCASAQTERVGSVTESLLLGVAVEMGLRPELRLERPEGLIRHEVWAVNALHGIRAVRSIDEITLPGPDPLRLHEFRTALDETWETVD